MFSGTIFTVLFFVFVFFLGIYGINEYLNVHCYEFHPCASSNGFLNLFCHSFL